MVDSQEDVLIHSSGSMISDDKFDSTLLIISGLYMVTNLPVSFCHNTEKILTKLVFYVTTQAITCKHDLPQDFLFIDLSFYSHSKDSMYQFWSIFWIEIKIIKKICCIVKKITKNDQ